MSCHDASWRWRRPSRRSASSYTVISTGAAPSEAKGARSGDIFPVRCTGGSAAAKRFLRKAAHAASVEMIGGGCHGMSCLVMFSSFLPRRPFLYLPFFGRGGRRASCAPGGVGAAPAAHRRPDRQSGDGSGRLPGTPPSAPDKSGATSPAEAGEGQAGQHVSAGVRKCHVASWFFAKEADSRRPRLLPAGSNFGIDNRFKIEH